MIHHMPSGIAAYRSPSFLSFPFITTAICRMDLASVALSKGLEPNEPRTYVALSKCYKVPRTTLWNRAHARLLKEEKTKRQQYLNPSKEKALIKYMLRISDKGYPIQ
jgi:hypothetical protein